MGRKRKDGSFDESQEDEETEEKKDVMVKYTRGTYSVFRKIEDESKMIEKGFVRS